MPLNVINFTLVRGEHSVGLCLFTDKLFFHFAAWPVKKQISITETLSLAQLADLHQFSVVCARILLRVLIGQILFELNESCVGIRRILGH